MGCGPQPAAGRKSTEEVGSVTGLATACAFFHKEKNIRMVVHGDDFIIEGAECDLRWVEATLDKVADDELWYETDPRHVEKMLNDMELEKCKESVVPGTQTGEQKDDKRAA